MAQAKKRKSKAAMKAKPKKKSANGFSSHGISMLLAGIVIGSLGTVMWQGYSSDDSDVGSGIRAAIQQSKQQATVSEDPIPEVVELKQQKTAYDFYDVLPAIAVSESDGEAPEKPKPAVVENEVKKPEIAPEVKAEVVIVKPKSVYMLQVGSYRRANDADRQKAKLALMGFSSSIQKVTSSSGNLYRVHLGPFVDTGSADSAEARLQQENIDTLRLTVSRRD